LTLIHLPDFKSYFSGNEISLTKHSPDIFPDPCGDAIIRKTIYEHTGLARIGFGILGTLLLFGYGFFLNLAPVEFGKVVGLYIATLFIVWQIITYFTFQTTPSLSVIVGGCFVVAGGLIITFWKA
jgi:hypothetical protein